MKTSEDFEELFELLNSHRVEYLIVGAHAVAFHAKPRYTKDVDVFVRPTQDNAERLLAALHAFGFGEVGLEASDFTQPGMVIQLVPGTTPSLLRRGGRGRLRRYYLRKTEIHLLKVVSRRVSASPVGGSSAGGGEGGRVARL